MANRIEQEIVVKVIGGKDVGALQKQIKALEKEKATLLVDVDVDDDESRKKLDDLDKQIAELKGEKAEIEVTAKVDRALSALDTVAAEAKKAEAAAEALSVALGPDIGAKADLDGIIADFGRMGLSMDDITANADRLGAKLRDVGTKDVGGRLTTGFNRIGDSAKSAGSSASVLANSIGNASQDIGAMGGLAGSTGVAVGQMGEYMADAVLSGEALGSTMANFAKVAGPIAIISAIVQGFTGAIGTMREEAEASAKRVEDFGEAMDGAANDSAALAGVLRENIDELRNFNTEAEGTGGLALEGIQRFAEAIPGLSALVKRPTEDVVAALNDAGITLFGIAEAAGGNVDKWRAMTAAMADARAEGRITAGQLGALEDFLNRQIDETRQAAEVQELYNVGVDEGNALLDELAKKGNPLEHYGDQWNTLMADIRDGTLDTEAAAAAVNFLHHELGLDPNEVISLALGRIAEEEDAATKALEDNAKAAKEWAQAQQDAADDAAAAMGEALGTITEMASSFSTMERNKEAIGAAFALGNAPLEALEAVTDINDAIRDLAIFIRDNDGVVPNIFDPNDVEAGAFLAKIESLRGPIQSAVGDAFAAGGPAAARATADAYVKQITASMRGKLTEAEVRNLLGLGDLEATIKIAVDQSSLAVAHRLLEALVGLQGGETPWTVAVGLALDAGTLSADAVRLLASQELERLGIPVPLSLEEPSEGSKTAATAAAQRFAAQNPVDMQTKVGDPKLAEIIRARNAGQEDADRLPIVFPSTVAAPRGGWFSGLFGHDGGGTVGAAGGVAGERGPEILNGRYLTTGTTYVPPGTKVTSRRRTAVVLRNHNLRGLRRYDAGGTVPMVSPTFNTTINAGVVGNRFDVARAVRKANHDIERLMGTR